ncbi:MAG: Maf family protein [Gammaproteobacteria bacterium]|nr:Maf family protein [Gammaproteobacteria bacterium]
MILASASPRRAALLEQIGVHFEVQPVHVDESSLDGECPRDYVTRLARLKASAIPEASVPVLGADTAVVLDEKIFGKPSDEHDAVAMLMALSGRQHQVLTGIAVCGGSSDARRCEALCVGATVGFVDISESDARRYWKTGEPADKAGGYGIQGIGGIFAERISGSYSAIVGLPLFETEQLLRSFNVDTWQFRG